MKPLSLILGALVLVAALPASGRQASTLQDPVSILQAGQAAVAAAHSVRFDARITLSEGTVYHGRLTLDRIPGRTSETILGFEGPLGVDASESLRRAELARGMDLMRRAKVVRIRAEIGDSLLGTYDGRRSALFEAAGPAVLLDTTGAGLLSERAAGHLAAANWFEAPSRFTFDALLETASVSFLRTDTVCGVLCDLIETEPFAHLPQAQAKGFRRRISVCVAQQDHFPRRIEQHISVQGRASSVTIVITNLKVNPRLDPDTFSTEVPDGYSVRHQTPSPFIWPSARRP